MKTTLPLFLTIATLLSSVGFAQDHEEKETELYASMERMNDAYRDLRRAMRGASDENKASYLELADVMLKEATDSKKLVPEKVKKLPEAEQEKMLEEYNRQMDGLISAVEAIRNALEKGDYGTANTMLRELRGIKSEGHDTFKED